MLFFGQEQLLHLVDRQLPCTQPAHQSFSLLLPCLFHQEAFDFVASYSIADANELKAEGILANRLLDDFGFKDVLAGERHFDGLLLLLVSLRMRLLFFSIFVL